MPRFVSLRPLNDRGVTLARSPRAERSGETKRRNPRRR